MRLKITTPVTFEPLAGTSIYEAITSSIFLKQDLLIADAKLLFNDHCITVTNDPNEMIRDYNTQVNLTS